MFVSFEANIYRIYLLISVWQIYVMLVGLVHSFELLKDVLKSLWRK